MCDHRELRAWAASDDPNECAKTEAEIEKLFKEALAAEQALRSGEHANAGDFFGNAEDRPGVFSFNPGQVLVAATAIVAKLQTERSFDQPFSGA